MKYILNSNCPENWGSEAYNGMEITREELERLASEWDTPISELMSDLECVSDDSKRVAEFYNRLTDKWEIRKDDFYLRYEGSLDIEEFKGGRIFPVRSIYSFIETCLPYLDVDTVEEDVVEDMEYSGRCEADELIHYIWESAKYSSLALRELDAWYD